MVYTQIELKNFNMLKNGAVRCNVAPLNRSTEILFKSDYAYVAILGVFSLLGGFIGKSKHCPMRVLIM